MPTLALYRQVLGAELGFAQTGLTTDGAGSSNSLVCSALGDSDLESKYYDGVWSIITSTQSGQSLLGQVRRVKQGGLSPVTGSLTMTRGYTASIASGTGFELYGVLPPVDALGRRGLLSCINLALRECWIEQYLQITGVANQWQYSLETAYPWLWTEDQVIDVWCRRSNALRDQLVEEWRLIEDADNPQIEFKAPFTTADVIKPYVHRPMDTWINTGTGYANSTTGLVADTDQAMLSIDGMLAVGLYHCYTALAGIGDDGERGEWIARRDRQRIKANVWKRAHLKRDVGRTFHWRNTMRQMLPQFPTEGSLG